MVDEWVMNIITKDCWRLNKDATKEVYLDENNHLQYKSDIGNYRFFPMCPKEAPQMECPEYGPQITMEDLIDG
jgi:hypothetical protein